MANPWSHIPIKECNEPLIMLDENKVVLANPHPYVALGAEYPEGVSPFMVRQSVADKLYMAADHLMQQRQGHKFLIWDGLRPLSVQKMMVDLTFQQLIERDGKTITHLSDDEKAHYMNETFIFWSVPSFDMNMPPLHSTGGAIDLTILDETGEEIDMGSPFDHPGAESYTDYFHDKDTHVHANRMFMKDLLEAEGFLNYEAEWWHFGYGDQLSALIRRKHGEANALAIYGRMTDLKS